MATGGLGNLELLRQQREACDRMMNALHDVIRQEQEVRRRVEAKKSKLADLQRQRESGDVVQPSHINQQQQVIADLNKKVEDLELALKYHASLPRAQAPLSQFDVSADNIPPPLPPRTSNRATHTLPPNIPGDVGPDQWLCVRCNTVNSNLMPFCANSNCTK